MNVDVVIIGGGAAGLMCAIEAGRRGRSAVVLEHQDRVGKKIRISGGGRCNFTNRLVTPDNFISDNPRFSTSALSRFTSDDFIARVGGHRISFYEKKDGQLFCTGSAQQIVDMLLEDCYSANVSIRTQCEVGSIDIRERSSAGRFSVRTAAGEISCDSVVIATGGLSIRKIGATDFGYECARRFGHTIVPPRPGLVPLLWQETERSRFATLAGVSLRASVSVGKIRFTDEILFTHTGVSGPAVLQISNYWREGEHVSIDLLPECDLEQIFEENRSSTMTVGAVLSRMLPRRFVDAFIITSLLGTPMNRLRKTDSRALIESLRAWTITPSGTEGFEKAEVTCGGVETREISSKTMESNRVAGLYFIGEVVDVTGWLGGYNFQWAWSSGWAAGQSV